LYTQIEVVEHVLRLLQESNRVSTYKPAVLLALIDLALEQKMEDGTARVQILTRDVAEKVISYYWDQTSPFRDGVKNSSRVLLQCTSHKSDSSQASIVSEIKKYRDTFGIPDMPRRAALAADQEGYRRLCDRVEWTLIAMPLPKLQRIGKESKEMIYSIQWRDGHNNQDTSKTLLQKSGVNKYQLDPIMNIDSIYATIQLLPGVALAFANLHSLLRPHVIQHWVNDVVRWNSLQHSDVSSDVSGFLFSDFRRTNLAPVRDSILDFDSGRCFYCDRSVSAGAEIDHFIPWARTHDDGIHNLVAACPACNQNKSDFFGSHNQLDKWLSRIRSRSDGLKKIADKTQWEFRPTQALARATNIYSRLPDKIVVWDAQKRFIPLNMAHVQRLLIA
jgi:5-methylcytosine-specific restriction endonuclease McrA